MQHTNTRNSTATMGIGTMRRVSFAPETPFSTKRSPAAMKPPAKPSTPHKQKSVPSVPKPSNIGVSPAPLSANISNRSNNRVFTGRAPEYAAHPAARPNHQPTTTTQRNWTTSATNQPGHGQIPVSPKPTTVMNRNDVLAANAHTHDAHQPHSSRVSRASSARQSHGEKSQSHDYYHDNDIFAALTPPPMTPYSDTRMPYMTMSMVKEATPWDPRIQYDSPSIQSQQQPHSPATSALRSAYPPSRSRSRSRSHSGEHEHASTSVRDDGRYLQPNRVSSVTSSPRVQSVKGSQISRSGSGGSVTKQKRHKPSTASIATSPLNLNLSLDQDHSHPHSNASASASARRLEFASGGGGVGVEGIEGGDVHANNLRVSYEDHIKDMEHTMDQQRTDVVHAYGEADVYRVEAESVKHQLELLKVAVKRNEDRFAAAQARWDSDMARCRNGERNARLEVRSLIETLETERSEHAAELLRFKQLFEECNAAVSEHVATHSIELSEEKRMREDTENRVSTELEEVLFALGQEKERRMKLEREMKGPVAKELDVLRAEKELDRRELARLKRDNDMYAAELRRLDGLVYGGKKKGRK